MSARLLAGARAVLRREGLVRALDLAARRPGQSCEDERMLWEFIDQPFTEGWMGVC